MSALAELVATAAAEAGGELALIDPAGAMSWRALAAAVDELKDALAPLAERRVALLLPQSARALALLAACDAARVESLLVAELYGEAGARAAMAQVGAEVLLTVGDRGLVELARGAPGGAASGGVLLLTSGSTGRPKCARHEWRTLAGAVKHEARFAGARFLLSYPLSHVGALQVVTQCLWNRGTLVIPASFAPRDALDALIAERVRYLSATPTFVRQLLLAAAPGEWAKAELSHVTLGGEIADQPLLDAIARARPGVRITHTYASTELGAVLSVTDGQAGFDAALIDGERLRLDGGELLVRRRPERAMLGYLGDDPPAEWARTGDLVEVRDGRARFLGRTGDLINVGGFKVSPAEVEAVIRGVPGVAEVAVSAHASSITGQLVKARLALAPGADGAQVKRAVQERCAEALPAHKRPRLIELADRLDGTWSGKLSRGPG